MSGVVVERWLGAGAAASATGAVSGRGSVKTTCPGFPTTTKITIIRKPLGILKKFFCFFKD